MQGKIYLSQAMAQRMALMHVTAGDDPLLNLTSREMDIFRLLDIGKSAGEIAANLKISHRRVTNVISTIKHTLNISTTSRLVHLGVEHS